MSIADDLARHLAGELGDAETARLLAEILREDALAWRPPTIAPQRIRSIFAFTFGNRMQENGNREPGPVNEALAEVAVELHRATGAPIFAQWEIAVAIGRRVVGPVTAIYPGRDQRAEPVYLSTGGVVEEIARLGPEGPVAVVAFADHLYRAVMTSRRYGFDAYAPEGIAMPAAYDPQSGQPWCRSRAAYLMHDIMIRVTERRADLLHPAP
ncbi:MAG TPA: hypothetical protein VGG57_05710 [Stellaceae bacterium]|jgi:hypothetical protein